MPPLSAPPWPWPHPQHLASRAPLDFSVPIPIPPRSNCTTTNAILAVFLVVAWACVLLRLLARAKIGRKLGWDDWFTLLSICFFTVYCAAVINIDLRLLAASPQAGLTWPNLVAAVMVLNVSEYFYALTIMALKIALGLFFLPLAVERWQRIVIYVAVTLSTLLSAVLFFYCIFQCGYYASSATFLFRRAGLEGGCASNAATLAVLYSHGAAMALTDWTFLILPVAIVRNSMMRRADKLSVMMILMFASISGIAALARFKYLPTFAGSKIDFFAQAKDVAIWTGVEPGVGIAASSIATLRPLFRCCMSRDPALDHPHRRNRRSPGKRKLSFLVSGRGDTGAGAPRFSWLPKLSFISPAILTGKGNSGGPHASTTQRKWELSLFSFERRTRGDTVQPRWKPEDQFNSFGSSIEHDKKAHDSITEISRNPSVAQPQACIEERSDHGLQSPTIPPRLAEKPLPAPPIPAMEHISNVQCLAEDQPGLRAPPPRAPGSRDRS